MTSLIIAVLEWLLPKGVTAGATRLWIKWKTSGVRVRYASQHEIPLSEVQNYAPPQELWGPAGPPRSWKDFALHYTVKYGGPDFIVTRDSDFLGTIQVRPSENKDTWDIVVLRPDGSEIAHAQRRLRASPQEVFVLGVAKAARRLVTHRNRS